MIGVDLVYSLACVECAPNDASNLVLVFVVDDLRASVRRARERRVCVLIVRSAPSTICPWCTSHIFRDRMGHLVRRSVKSMSACRREDKKKGHKRSLPYVIHPMSPVPQRSSAACLTCVYGREPDKDVPGPTTLKSWWTRRSESTIWPRCHRRGSPPMIVASEQR